MNKHTMNPPTFKIRKDYIRFKFDYKKGCKNLEEIETLTDIPPQLRAEAKKVITEEVNNKVRQIRMNPMCYCWLIAILLLFVIGMVGISYISPYNFIFMGLGFVGFLVFLIFVLLKNGKHAAFFQKASAEMSRQTGGKMILEFIMKTLLFNMKPGARRQAKCVGILLRHKDSEMTIKGLKAVSDKLVVKNQNQKFTGQNNLHHAGNVNMPNTGYQQPNLTNVQQLPQNDYATPNNINNINMGQNNGGPIYNVQRQGEQQGGYNN